MFVKFCNKIYIMLYLKTYKYVGFIDTNGYYRMKIKYIYYSAYLFEYRLQLQKCTQIYRLHTLREHRSIIKV